MITMLPWATAIGGAVILAVGTGVLLHVCRPDTPRTWLLPVTNRLRRPQTITVVPTRRRVPLERYPHHTTLLQRFQQADADAAAADTQALPHVAARHRLAES